MKKALIAAVAALVLTMPAYADIASWYGPSGKPTACGHAYTGSQMIVAHRSLPCGSQVRLCNNHTGRCVTATVDDRGPFIRGRTWDLSAAVHSALGCGGLCDVSAESRTQFAENNTGFNFFGGFQQDPVARRRHRR